MAQTSRISQRGKGLVFHVYAPFLFFAICSIISADKTVAPSTTSGDSNINSSATTTNNVVEKTASSAALLEYVKSVSGPLEEDGLVYPLDYYNEKAMMEEFDFEPADFMKKLANSAASHGTPPAQFTQDILDLLALQNRSLSEQSESPSRSDTPKLLSEMLLKRMTDGWKSELSRLEKKYNISSEVAGPDSITTTRLALMYPHLINFGQKPFAAPLNITVGFSGRDENCERGYGGCRTDLYDANIPSILGRPEFGGLIPLVQLDEIIRRMIIGTHLYALHRNSVDDMVPFRTKCFLLKRRMERSLLSEDRRVRFLRSNEIVHKNGTLLRTSIKNVYDRIPKTFKDNIDWDLLTWEVPVYGLTRCLL
ncbi:unnamed protein product [Bemisia tabaci]|uniref:Uncharacterized protein n=1 Tax=Bemisia tabaci TaxID=7038 RepID=A0A9P0F2P2_BEMTA|nr:unnamed protein product [Bemisia tabaci]